MPRSGQFQADRVPVVMKALRIERRWTPAEHRGVGGEPRLFMAIAAVGAVFVCFFVIGRVSSPGASARSEAPLASPLASAGAAIPTGLSSAPPLLAGAVVSPSSSPRRPSPTPAPSEVARPLATQVFPTPGQFSAAPPPSSAAPPTASEPGAVTAPASTPTRSVPAPEHFGSGGNSSGSGGSTPSASGGGLFDSSG
jgi:hypothetical protein